MPQKRNPGLLNDTREQASTALALAMGAVIQAHNLPPGMPDPKAVKASSAMVDSAVTLLRRWDQILNALVIDRARALEELNSDWTASQELADALMREYKLPFRVGHHFASDLVEYTRAKDIKPPDFPYAQARLIYARAVQGLDVPAALPLSEAEFRAALDPVAIVRHRATLGGPQPAEMARMLQESGQDLARQDAWITASRARIQDALAGLDRDFDKLLSAR